MPLINLLPDTENQIIPASNTSLHEKLRHATSLQQNISNDLLALHETSTKRKLRIFLYYGFMIIAAITTLVSQVLPNFVRFGKNNSEKQAMDVTNWILGGISVVTGILAWLLSSGQETKNLASLSNGKKEKISQLELTLSDIHANCNIQFSNNEETKELYSSTGSILTTLVAHLQNGNESTIASAYEAIKQVDSIITTINAIDRLQKNTISDEPNIELEKDDSYTHSNKPMSSGI